ncbi:MAG TPA: TIGR02301 family protein [Xanthobacteraceae bacterium]|nr:TIGR02301 family protein [Xanthobacteraceae bacterium]
MRRTLIAALVAGAMLGPARAAESDAPFDNDLMRLSEILGGLHYLRGLCNPNEGPKWRTQMQALIDAEAPAGSPRRAHMMASFNRGYRGFQQAYRSCTPAADLAIRRYLDEGAKISREVTARYAN